MTHAAVARIATSGLGATPETPVRVTPASWPGLRMVIEQERLAALALDAVARSAIELPEDAPDELRALRRHNHSADLVLERLLVEAVRVLGEVGIRAWTLKGPALAHQIYPDPGLRSFGDVDLLVAGTDLEPALEALTRAFGARRRFPEPRPGFDRRFSKGVCLETADGLEIDVHRTLAPGPFGLRIPLETLVAQPSSVRIGGHDLAVLAPEAALLHACLHAALGDVVPRIATLRDLAQLAGSPALDADRFARLVERCGARAPVSRAVTLARRTLGLTDDDLATLIGAAGGTLTRKERSLLAAYGQRRGRYPLQCAASFWELRGTERLAFGHALLMPSRSYLRTRDRSYGARLARAAALATGAATSTAAPTAASTSAPTAASTSAPHQETAWTAR